MLAMHVTRTFHPPAGIDPLLVMVNNLSWSFLLAPVAAGALLLAAFAYAWHLAVRRLNWPIRWWSPALVAHDRIRKSVPGLGSNPRAGFFGIMR
jgi:CBS-domain-containing membrane protein